MASHQGFHRNRVWVNGLIQGRVLTYISIYWMLYHFLLLHATFIYMIYQNSDTMLIGDKALPITAVYGKFLGEHAGFIICGLFVLPVVLFDALWFSHRVVGPLYRIRVALQQLAAGVDVAPIHLRKQDYLHNVAEVVNDVRDYVEQIKKASVTERAAATQSACDVEISDDDQHQVRGDHREQPRSQTVAECLPSTSNSESDDALAADVAFEPDVSIDQETTFAEGSLEAQLIEHTRDIEELVTAKRGKTPAEPAHNP